MDRHSKPPLPLLNADFGNKALSHPFIGNNIYNYLNEWPKIWHILYLVNDIQRDILYECIALSLPAHHHRAR